MASAHESGSSGPVSTPGWGHCVVFLGKTLYSHGASLHLGDEMGTLRWSNIRARREVEIVRR